MYENVIFDVDGTLIDSNHVILSTLRRVIREESGIEKSRIDLEFALGIPGNEVLEKIGFENQKTAEARWNIYLDEANHLYSLFEGVRQMLEQLMRKGINMGIVTSRSRDDLYVIFDNLDLHQYFKKIVCMEDTESHKPDAAPVLKYIASVNADPSGCIYIGDTQYDSYCASNADIDFGLVSWGANPGLKINSKYLFNKPQDILEILFS